MNDTSPPFCARIRSGVFPSRLHGDGLGSCARPLTSVVADTTVWPLLPMTSMRAPSTGRPVRIDCTNTSRLPSLACFTMKPRSVTRMSRVSSSPAVVVGVALLVDLFGVLAAQRAPRAEVQQEEAALRCAVSSRYCADVDAVVGRLAGLFPAVVARRREPLDQLVFDAAVERRAREVPHLRRQVLELIGQHAGDLDVHVLDVAREEADLAVAGQRQQRTLRRETSAPVVGLDPDRCDVTACPTGSRRCPGRRPSR